MSGDAIMSGDEKMNIPRQGEYPRVNSTMLETGDFAGRLVSIVGTYISHVKDSGRVKFRCADGGTVFLLVEKDFKFFEKYNVEVMGSVNDDRTVNVSLFFPLFMKLLLPFNTLPQFFRSFLLNVAWARTLI